MNDQFVIMVMQFYVTDIFILLISFLNKEIYLSSMAKSCKSKSLHITGA